MCSRCLASVSVMPSSGCYMLPFVWRCSFKKELKKRKIPVEDYSELRACWGRVWRGGCMFAMFVPALCGWICCCRAGRHPFLSC